MLIAQSGARAVPGDIAGNGTDEPDGFVEISDLNRILGNWNVTCDPGDWTKGDIDGDGFVGIDDLNIVLGHFNQSDPDPFLGTNLAPVAYWNTPWAFVDVIKMARPWLADWGGAITVPTDANGWPTSNPSGLTVFSHVFDHVSSAYPAGDYILTWEGTADVTVVWDGTTNPDPGGNPNRKIVTVIPTSLGLKINIDNIDNSNPQIPTFGNIRLWMPGFENATSPFHPLFVSRLRAFRVLRFMDWQKTNGSSEVQWSDRKQPTHAFQNDKSGGVALEYMIELCNELNADPWFCMPHRADDNYVTQFAQQVRDTLHNDATTTIYVEYSNELWNSKFAQYDWLNPVPRSNPWFDKWANEAANDFGIWETVFTGDARTIVRVLAGQKTNVWIVQKLISRMKDPNDPNGKDVLFDAIACSTYFYKKTNDPDIQQTAQGFLANAITHIPVDDADDYNDHALEIQKLSDPVVYPNTYTGRPITFISYEGGQHFVPNDDSNISFTIGLEMQRDPLMYQAYIANIAAFKAAGGSLYMAFNSVNTFKNEGMFGHFEFQNESINDAPKHRAVIGGGGR